jgi:uncharacterized membrane protein YoaK (UPF0700 family)
VSRRARAYSRRIPGAPHRYTGLLLSAIAGFVDTAGYLALFGIFTAHVTGNLVVAGATVAREPTDHFVIRLALLPMFVIAVAIAVFVVRRARTRARSPITSLLALESVVLVAFMSLGVAFEDRVATNAAALFAVSSAGVVAMGLQNGLARLVALGPPTSIMTGNVTQLSIDLVDTLVPETDERRREARTRLATTGRLIVGFVLGGAAGAALVRILGFWSLAVPIAALAIVIALERRAAGHA